MEELKYYDTQQEAETEKDRRADLMPKQRCPLFLLGQCMTACVCYQMPYIQKIDSRFRVHDGYCGNGMFQDRPELQI